MYRSDFYDLQTVLALQKEETRKKKKTKKKETKPFIV